MVSMISSCHVKYRDSMSQHNDLYTHSNKYTRYFLTRVVKCVYIIE